MTDSNLTAAESTRTAALQGLDLEGDRSLFLKNNLGNGFSPKQGSSVANVPAYTENQCFGSFQDLLRSATSGTLSCRTLSVGNETDYWLDNCDEAATQDQSYDVYGEAPGYVQSASHHFATAATKLDCYNLENGKKDMEVIPKEIRSITNKEQCTRVEGSSGKRVCFDFDIEKNVVDGFGEISDDEDDYTAGAENVGDLDDMVGEESKDDIDEERTTTALGDCGCSSGQDTVVIDETGNSDREDDSADEEEIIIDADLQQEIYVDKEQSGVPYRKRKRFNGTMKRPNCRKPRSMSAIEKALRSSSTRKTKHNFEPIVGMVFDSREEAREFYNLYSWEVGFGVKYNNSRCNKGGSRSKIAEINKDEEYRTMQDIVCQKSGFDSRVKSRTRRCGCPAKIHLLRTDDYGWIENLELMLKYGVDVWKLQNRQMESALSRMHKMHGCRIQRKDRNCQP